MPRNHDGFHVAGLFSFSRFQYESKFFQATFRIVFGNTRHFVSQNMCVLQLAVARDPKPKNPIFCDCFPPENVTNAGNGFKIAMGLKPQEPRKAIKLFEINHVPHMHCFQYTHTHTCVMASVESVRERQRIHNRSRLPTDHVNDDGCVRKNNRPCRTTPFSHRHIAF